MLRPMDGEELKAFVPELLEARYPGMSREADPGAETFGGGGFGWILEANGALMVIRASQTSNPFIWIKGGIAHAIPRSESLALDVAAGNRDLVVGRLYLAYNDEIAMVAFDEAIFGAYLSHQYEPSIVDVVNRFEASLKYTAEWSQKVLQKFGGRPFTGEDWGLLSL